MVVEGDARRGRLSAALQLDMNFGGRTHMLIYRHLDDLGNVSHATFEAKEGGEQTVRLNDPDFEKPLKDSKKEHISTISGEAYPLKFVTPLVVSEASARKKLR